MKILSCFFVFVFDFCLFFFLFLFDYFWHIVYVYSQYWILELLSHKKTTMGQQNFTSLFSQGSCLVKWKGCKIIWKGGNIYFYIPLSIFGREVPIYNLLSICKINIPFYLYKLQMSFILKYYYWLLQRRLTATWHSYTVT